LAASAVTAWQLGRLELASNWCLQAIALGYPRDAMPLVLIHSELAMASGDTGTAAEELAKAFEPLGCRKQAEGDLRHILACIAGEVTERGLALAAMRRLEEREEIRSALYCVPVIAGLVMMLNARLGELDHAHEIAAGLLPAWKESGLIDQLSLMLFWPECMEEFRADRRFTLLCDQLGMVEYWRRFGVPRTLLDNSQIAELIGKPAAA
jgi:hypothetical protein